MSRLDWIIVFILILLLIGAIPHWGNIPGWGFYPVGGIGIVLAVITILLLVGRI